MDDLLQQGIAAYKAGRRDEARRIFIIHVKQNPNDERSWGRMYDVCNSDQERIHCLKQILRINPRNEKAKQLLSSLTVNDFPFELSKDTAETRSTQEQGKNNSDTAEIRKEVSNTTSQNGTSGITSQIVWSILIAVGIIAGIYFLLNTTSIEGVFSPPPPSGTWVAYADLGTVTFTTNDNSTITNIIYEFNDYVDWNCNGKIDYFKHERPTGTLITNGKFSITDDLFIVDPFVFEGTYNASDKTFSGTWKGVLFGESRCSGTWYTVSP